MAPGDQSARVTRERDRGLPRAMGATLLISACLVGGVLGIVGLRVNQVKLSYRLAPLRPTRGGAEEGGRPLGAGGAGDPLPVAQSGEDGAGVRAGPGPRRRVASNRMGGTTGPAWAASQVT